MKERDIQTIFGKHNKLHGVFELKLCKGPSIRYDAVAPHQMESLKAAGGQKGLYHRLTDQPWMNRPNSYTLKKPFDCFFLKGVASYIVICLYTPRLKKLFCYIPPEKWEQAEKESTKKSINREEIISLATHYLEIR